MSRLGKTPLVIPKGVELKVEAGGCLRFKGPKGSLELRVPEGLRVKLSEKEVLVEKEEKTSIDDAMHGLYRALIKNYLMGVAEGFEVKLSLIGVGYRAAVQGNQLDLSLGYSYPTKVAIPSGIQVLVDKGTSISIKGLDKRVVGQFAAAVRAMKPPEPYKGKGIRYENEFVRKKEGKAAKGKA